MNDPSAHAPAATHGAALTREQALSRWDNEGGSLADPAPQTLLPDLDRDHDRDAADPAQAPWAEWMHLRMRVIALENVVIALLAEASPEQRELVREMAGCIMPRPGAVAHPLTLRAAQQMSQLVDRAAHFAVD